jgi:AraC-like DNA-binding protein
MSQLGRSAGLTGFLDLCRETGVDAYALAAAAGLPDEVLTNPDLRVSAEAMGRMWEIAAEQSGVDDFALRAGERRKISNLGAIGLVIREQPTVRKALQAYTRYQWLQNDAYHVSVEIAGEQVLVRINGPVWQTRQIAELSMVTALRTLKTLLGERWRPQEVWFQHAAPPRLETHRRLFGVTPLFELDGMAIVMTRADLDAPIPSADPAIAASIAQYLEQLTEQRSVQLADKVGDLIVALLPDGACSVERVAQHLGMDRRTLHRRLSAEGVTFSSILDDKRRDMAASLLTYSERPLQNVADLLGFSSLSAFAHWFRRKFDQPASAYRARHAAGERPSGILAAAG